MYISTALDTGSKESWLWLTRTKYKRMYAIWPNHCRYITKHEHHALKKKKKGNTMVSSTNRKQITIRKTPKHFQHFLPSSPPTPASQSLLTSTPPPSIPQWQLEEQFGEQIQKPYYRELLHCWKSWTQHYCYRCRCRCHRCWSWR